MKVIRSFQTPHDIIEYIVSPSLSGKVTAHESIFGMVAYELCAVGCTPKEVTKEIFDFWLRSCQESESQMREKCASASDDYGCGDMDKGICVHNFNRKYKLSEDARHLSDVLRGLPIPEQRSVDTDAPGRSEGDSE